jgi:phenylacetate-CoA ligase
MTMVWEPEKECMQRDELRQLQLEQLQAVLARVYMHVPFYRKQFDACKVDPDDFCSLDDLRRLPFTSKTDLQENYPYGLFAVPLRDVVRIHASACMSTVVGYTRNDIKTWSSSGGARALRRGREQRRRGADRLWLRSVDRRLRHSLWRRANRRLGHSHIHGQHRPPDQDHARFQDHGAGCTPSYALLIADTIHKQGINPGVLSLKYGLFGGEPWSEAMRQEIQDKLHIVATDNYGVSEVMGPGVASECMERNGLHINEDHFLVEVVDPQTLEPLPIGETGELVITTLTKEAFPVIRFRTRDLTSLLAEPCPCGRKTMRMARVAGRSDDVLIIRGTKVSPAQIAPCWARSRVRCRRTRWWWNDRAPWTR